MNHNVADNLGFDKYNMLYQKYLSKRSVKQKGTKYASDFFPRTYWDEVKNATVRFGYTQGKEQKDGSIRILTERWKGNSDRPIRDVQFLDLSRIVPISGRTGYAKIAKSSHVEASSCERQPAYFSN